MAEMFRNWICEAIEGMLTEFDSEGMNIEGWRCVGINDKGIKEYVVVDREDRVMFSCKHIDDAEFYIKMFKMRKWEDVNIINMCERRNNAQ